MSRHKEVLTALLPLKHGDRVRIRHGYTARANKLKTGFQLGPVPRMTRKETMVLILRGGKADIWERGGANLVHCDCVVTRDIDTNGTGIWMPLSYLERA